MKQGINIQKSDWLKYLEKLGYEVLIPTNMLRVSQYLKRQSRITKMKNCLTCCMGTGTEGQYMKSGGTDVWTGYSKAETYGTVNRGIFTTSMLIRCMWCLGGCRKLGRLPESGPAIVWSYCTDHKDMNALLWLWSTVLAESNIGAEEVVQFFREDLWLFRYKRQGDPSAGGGDGQKKTWAGCSGESSFSGEGRVWCSQSSDRAPLS